MNALDPAPPTDVPAPLEAQARETRRLDDLLEAERRWLARDLRDDLGQELTAVRLEVEALQALAPGGALSARVRRVAEAIERSHACVRFMADSLRPRILDEEGVAASVRWLARQLRERTGRFCEARVELTEEPDDAVGLAVFRVVQEALADATCGGDAPVELTLRGDSRALTLVLVDCAQRREAPGRRPGLVGMRERTTSVGGALRRHEGPSGTRIDATFPRRADERKP